MKCKTIIGLFSFLTLLASFNSYGEERDYKQLFRTCQALIAAKEVKGESIQIEPDEELNGILENGLNSFNVLAPYTQMKEDLKSIINDLANFQFTLRSPTSSEIYQKAAPATVIVYAPEIAWGSGFVVNKQKGLIVTNFHVTRSIDYEKTTDKYRDVCRVVAWRRRTNGRCKRKTGNVGRPDHQCIKRQA